MATWSDIILVGFFYTMLARSTYMLDSLLWLFLFLIQAWIGFPPGLPGMCSIYDYVKFLPV
jgi:hypothetical protein